MGQGLAAQGRAGGHADEHGGQQHRVQAAAGGRLQAVDQRLVGHQRGLHAEVEADGGQHQQRQPGRGRQPQLQRHGGEGQGGQAGAQAGHPAGAAAVGQPAGQRRGQGAGRTGQAEGTGRGAAHLVALEQHHRQRGPEGAEAHRQQALGPGRAAQRGVALPQLGQRAHQRAIAQRGGGRQVGQAAPAGHADGRHAHRRQAVDGAPAELLGHQAAGHPRQQDAQQQARHHRADGAAAQGLRRQRGRGRHDVLGHGGRHPHHQAGGQQQAHARGQAAGQQGQGQAGGLQGDQVAAVVPVAQRRQQQDAQRVAQLGQRGHQADGAGAGMQAFAELAQQRLAVVDGRDGQAGAGGHQQHQRGGQGALSGWDGGLRGTEGLDMGISGTKGWKR